jgi:hypothetical protein
MLRLVDELERQTEEFETLARDAAEKEAAFKRGWASAYLRGEGSIRNREAMADYGTADLFHAHVVSEALVKAKRESLLFLRTSIDALRTLNANVRAQVSD